jgi:hypothetical protein
MLGDHLKHARLHFVHLEPIPPRLSRCVGGPGHQVNYPRFNETLRRRPRIELLSCAIDVVAHETSNTMCLNIGRDHATNKADHSFADIPDGSGAPSVHCFLINGLPQLLQLAWERIFTLRPPLASQIHSVPTNR